MASVNAIKVWWDENTCVSSFTNNVVNFFDQDGMKKQHIIHWMEENLYEYYGKWSSQQRPGSPYCVRKTTFFIFKPPYVWAAKVAYQCVCIYQNKLWDALNAFKCMHRDINKECYCNCTLCEEALSATSTTHTYQIPGNN